MTTKTTEALKIENINKQLADLGYDQRCLDLNHESATNWLHTLRTSLALTPSPRDIAAAHDRLMEIQDNQDALGQRIGKLMQERDNN